MDRFLLGAAIAAIVAGPAAAVQVTGVSAGAGNLVAVFDAAPGLLQADFAFGRQGLSVLDLQVEAGDEDGIRFDSLVGVDSGFLVGQNLKGLVLSLQGGPTFSVIGDVAAAFSLPVVTGSAGGTRVQIRFQPDGEGAEALLGNVFGGADGDFVISVAGLSAGDTFQLRLLGVVPEASTWAMLIAGFGLVGGAMRRRRAQVAA
jgi:hypothetical protein